MSNLIVGHARGCGLAVRLVEDGMRIPECRGLTAEQQGDPSAVGWREPTNEFVIPGRTTYPLVVPAKAGTHNHREEFCEDP
jgi:hypothetical protein